MIVYKWSSVTEKFRIKYLCRKERLNFQGREILTKEKTVTIFFLFHIPGLSKNENTKSTDANIFISPSINWNLFIEILMKKIETVLLEKNSANIQTNHN